jgi:glucose-1-phosphate thymidylyltransferase
MKQSTIKVVIPMAGLGTRLRPHTWSKPKQLVSVAGKTVLDHLIDTFATLPSSLEIELIAIVGYLGDQIEEHIRFNYPDLKSYFVVQENPVGQSHAIKLAEQYLGRPMLVFADTLIETDLSILENEKRSGDLGASGTRPAPLRRDRAGRERLGEAPDREAAGDGEQPGGGRFLLF